MESKTITMEVPNYTKEVEYLSRVTEIANHTITTQNETIKTLSNNILEQVTTYLKTLSKSLFVDGRVPFEMHGVHCRTGLGRESIMFELFVHRNWYCSIQIDNQERAIYSHCDESAMIKLVNEWATIKKDINQSIEESIKTHYSSLSEKETNRVQTLATLNSFKI